MPDACSVNRVLNRYSLLLYGSLDCTFDSERGTMNAGSSESCSEVVGPALPAVVVLRLATLTCGLLAMLKN
jgi:hypothetical protein